jgi:hypothetical protein
MKIRAFNRDDHEPADTLFTQFTKRMDKMDKCMTEFGRCFEKNSQLMQEMYKQLTCKQSAEQSPPIVDLSVGSMPPTNADKNILDQWFENQGTYARIVREVMYMFPGGTRREREDGVEHIIAVVYGYPVGSANNKHLRSTILTKLRQLKQAIRDIINLPFLKNSEFVYINTQADKITSLQQVKFVWGTTPPEIVDMPTAGMIFEKIRAVMLKGDPIVIPNYSSDEFNQWALFIVSTMLLCPKSKGAEEKDDDFNTVIRTMFTTERMMTFVTSYKESHNTRLTHQG